MGSNPGYLFKYFLLTEGSDQSKQGFVGRKQYPDQYSYCFNWICCTLNQNRFKKHFLFRSVHHMEKTFNLETELTINSVSTTLKAMLWPLVTNTETVPLRKITRNCRLHNTLMLKVKTFWKVLLKVFFLNPELANVHCIYIF